MDEDIIRDFYRLEMVELAVTAQEGRKTMAKEEKKNFKAGGYSEYETLDEARIFAARDTARSFSPVSIWQRIEETVVPAIDVQINPVDVKTTPVVI